MYTNNNELFQGHEVPCYKSCKLFYFRFYIIDLLLSGTSDMAQAMYQCKLCDKKFDQPQTLALHEKHHDYKFQCGVCARKMKTEREFLRHEATHAESSSSTHIRKPKGTKAQKFVNVSEAPVMRDESIPLHTNVPSS